MVDWFITDPWNHYVGLMCLLVAAAGFSRLAAGARLVPGQCGHPTRSGTLCQRALAAGKDHCGIPGHAARGVPAPW